MPWFGKKENAEAYKNKKYPNGVRAKIRTHKLADDGFVYFGFKCRPFVRSSVLARRITRLEKKLEKLTEKRAHK
jgi:hypothetical protein